VLFDNKCCYLLFSGVEMRFAGSRQCHPLLGLRTAVTDPLYIPLPFREFELVFFQHRLSIKEEYPFVHL